MRRDTLTAWTLISGIAMLDLLICPLLGLHFTGWTRPLGGGALLLAVGLFYRLSGRSRRLAQMTEWSLAWLAFATAGAVLTYIAARCGGALHDIELAASDRALGFDWGRWYGSLAGRDALRLVLGLTYASVLPQIVISIVYFSLCGDDRRNGELLLSSLVGLLIATAIFLRFPALGHLPVARQTYLPTLLALRGGGDEWFDIGHMQGVISFPSYHMVLAVLLVWAHRRSPLLIPLAFVNCVMVFAIPSDGGHYLADILAGAVVAVLSVLAAAPLQERHRLRPAPAARAALPGSTGIGEG